MNLDYNLTKSKTNFSSSMVISASVNLEKNATKVKWACLRGVAGDKASSPGCLSGSAVHADGAFKSTTDN